MKIKSSELVLTEVALSKFPTDDLFEIVLLGKSNVGKSSFINSFCNRKNLARISGTPGKTRTANFYLINGVYYFVDMPGYGYAKVSKSLKESFQGIIYEYIEKRSKDFSVFLLLDSRHEPGSNDLEILDYLKQKEISPVIILTKYDKLSGTEKETLKQRFIKYLGREDDEDLFPYSILNETLIQSMRDFTSLFLN
jgi:GTP-binding protein